MKALAILTARGGSKRIPRKNVKPFAGKPILAWPLEAARESGLFDEIMVSTDDDEIAAIAEQHGAAFPFRRSAKASDDHATTADVLIEVVEEYARRGTKPDIVCCLYPTAPFVTAGKLREAFAMLERTGADGVLPVTAFSFPILRSLAKDGDRVAFNWPEHALTRSQDLPPAFHDAGQFYVLKTDALLRTGRLMTDNMVGIETSGLEVQDIDHEEDWKLAELKFEFLRRAGR